MQAAAPYAMSQFGPGQTLVFAPLPKRPLAPHELRIRVLACGVCRTDLHVVDGELPHTVYPVIPGHEVVGRVDQLGSAVVDYAIGQRVGVSWLAETCGSCAYCRAQRENLCDSAKFTGYTRPGGFASHISMDSRFVIPLKADGDDAADAPLLCAGLIGWRSLERVSDARRVGLYGFGAAAHIALQLLRHDGREVYAFTRPGDSASQEFARSLGAAWAGSSEEPPPHLLDAAIIYAPVGALIPAALAAVRRGGRVVCAGIHMSDIPSFAYDLLWGERELVSVANVRRADAPAFFAAAEKAGVHTHITSYPLIEAARALADLRGGRLQGAAVLIP